MHYPEPSTTVGWDLGVRWDGVWGWDGMGCYGMGWDGMGGAPDFRAKTSDAF